MAPEKDSNLWVVEFQEKCLLEVSVLFDHLWLRHRGIMAFSQPTRDKSQISHARINPDFLGDREIMTEQGCKDE